MWGDRLRCVCLGVYKRERGTEVHTTEINIEQYLSKLKV